MTTQQAKRRSIITVGSQHGLKVGDVIELRVPDKRWWRVLWYWIFRHGFPALRTRKATVLTTATYTVEVEL